MQNIHAQKLGARGGKARASRLAPERLSEIGKAGAQARWELPREMKQDTKALLQAAEEARGKLRTGAISYEEARGIAQAYIDHANEMAREIAKEFGARPKKMDVRAFLR